MRKLIIALVVILGLGVAGYGGYRGYKKWRHHRQVAMGKEYLQKGDLRNALLALRQAVESRPNDLEATMIMADLMELLRAPTAVAWRNRVVQLDPTSLTNRLFLARTAIAYNDLESARKAVDGVPAALQTNVAYHKVAGAVATATRDVATAEKHLVEASRIEPDNLTTRMNLSVLRLTSTNAAVVAAARQTLQTLATNPPVRAEALRQLVLDALGQNKPDQALGYAQQLLKDTNAGYSDRVLHLGILRAVKNPQFEANLLAVQREASTNAPKAYDLGRWMIGAGMTNQALVWLRSLPAATQTNQPVPMILADALAANREWTNLLATLDKQDWTGVEYLQLLQRTRALKGQGLDNAARAEWAKAVKATGGTLDRLALLLRNATQWGWQAEQEEILWAIANKFPSEKWAWQVLGMRLHAAGQTRQLLTLYDQVIKANPNDPSVKNNLAMCALLLGAMERKPQDMAKELYDKTPASPTYASTYALSLYLEKKSADALRVLEQLKPEELEEPSIAAYYGLALNGVGQKQKSAKYFALASKAHLLPEEQKLLDRAKAGL